MRRLASAVLLILLGAFFLGFGAAPATAHSPRAAAPRSALAAPDDVTITGTGPAAITAPGTVTLHYTITVPDSTIGEAVLTAAEPTGVTADAATVQVGGVLAQPATVTSANGGLVIRLGVGADAANGGELAVGAYLVSFTVDIATAQPADAVASASLSYALDAVTHTAQANDIPLAQPDLAMKIPADSGEDQLLPLGTGQEGIYGAELTNTGADAAAVTVTIDFPDSLAIDLTSDEGGVFRDDQWQSEDDNGGSEVPCTVVSPEQITCAIGTVTTGTDTLITVPFTTTATSVYNQQAKFTLTATPDGIDDANPADNAVSGTVLFTGEAHLRAGLTPAATHVPVGKTTKIRASITNLGPQPALATFALTLLDNNTHFRITAFSGKLASDQGTDVHAATRSASTPGWAAAAAPSPIVGPDGFVWDVGTIPAGHTASAVLTIKAVSVGGVQVALIAESEAADPPCESESGDGCEDFAVAELHAVKATAAHHPSSSAAGPISSAGTPQLAATGSGDTGRLLLVGIAMTVLGGCLTMAGRRRRLAN